MGGVSGPRTGLATPGVHPFGRHASAAPFGTRSAPARLSHAPQRRRAPPLSSAGPSHGSPPAAPLRSPVHLTNHGGGASPGPVTIVPLFWGFDPGPKLRLQLDTFYSRLEQSKYYAWIRREYGAPALQHISPSPTQQRIWSGNVKQDDLQNEIDDLVRSGGVLNVPNPLYVIHLAPGATVLTDDGKQICNQIFGYKTSFSTWTLFGGGRSYQYVAILDSTSPCLGNPAIGFDSLTRDITHEVIENLTNPQMPDDDGNNGNGWWDPGQPAGCGIQIADLCVGQMSRLATSIVDPVTGGTSFTVQKIWSNALNACVTEDTVGALLQ